MRVNENVLVDKVKTIILGLSAIIIWVAFINILLTIVTQNQHHLSSQTFTVEKLFFACIFAPLWEEMCFRRIPATVANVINPELLWPTMIMSAAIFGWGHGHGPVSLLYQGTMGLVFSYVYIKNEYCYWSAVATHALWNLLCFILPV